ncbi:aminotransferase class I/II-fold pyridoxal phosphate-dependent enzyme [Saccharospirillum salsuginis]|uniref:Aminotransferase n=1 Tax=Saccharospirillum salsuginis TaxID=418750 RepID=A0A918KGE5_9GAMM|nr:aminotransferase class I/II-fold pyridoxal phosphate-dependent enzyme [Saccharospirillum salsuginis]GGX62580.1 aminotransferase [Saccharospirillum salsuginis]
MTPDLASLSQDQLKALESDLSNQYDTLKQEGLSLDLTRGKPSTEQLDLSNALDGLLGGDYQSRDGVDVRNYGGLDGLTECRELGAELLGMPVEQVLAGGSSSLTLMHQAMSIAYHDGLSGPGSAWHLDKNAKCLCPVPGYDRHFAICEHLGIEMIPVPMTDAGPDMDAVEKALEQDPSIKALWCVPRFSNPTGIVYSDETVRRIAHLGRIAGEHFRVFWDNAYSVHALNDQAPALANVFDACREAGTEDSVLQFASTSKITFAGSGVAFLGASDKNLQHIKASLSALTIGPDKVNQLRHARFFAQDGSLKAHMKQHAALLKPRFDTVLKHLNDAFGDNDLGQWNAVEGGYFISFNTRPGLAKETVRLALGAGVKLTPAGATYPYGKDPEDANIRIAPSVPSVSEVDDAMRVFTLCVTLASVRQALQH